MIGASNDVLGLLATADINITPSVANSDMRIDAAMFALGDGGSTGQFNTTGSGRLTVCGSVCEGKFGKNNMSKSYHWDTRFADPAKQPPFYPGFGNSTYKITNWWESARRAAPPLM
jgi:hypothetical protein